MDVDTTIAVVEVGGEEDIAETQDDSLSLPGMDSPRIEVEEAHDDAESSHTKVY